jgi:ABC-2 type transport system permease protein
VFYSISLLPDFWYNVSLINPILYMVNTFRYGILGTSDVSISLAYAMIIGAITLLYIYSYKLLSSGRGLRS